MILNIADLHLTSDPMDEYRWDFLPWLKNVIWERKITRLNILGDLTEKKDRHSSELVNRLSSFLLDLADIVDINILQGNHDYVMELYPFFKFLSRHPKIRYINKKVLEEGRTLYVPWSESHIENMTVNKVYTHSNFIGVKYANGVESTEGILQSLYPNATIISGHIHVPQIVDKLIMVGSPYPIDFGDDFTGRALLEKGDGYYEDIRYPSIRKIKIIVDPEEPKLVATPNSGDQIKIEVILSPSRFKDWTTIKNTVKAHYESLGVVIRSITLIPKMEKPSLEEIKKEKNDKDLISDYGLKHGIPMEWVVKGRELADETTKIST